MSLVRLLSLLLICLVLPVVAQQTRYDLSNLPMRFDVNSEQASVQLTNLDDTLRINRQVLIYHEPGQNPVDITDIISQRDAFSYPIGNDSNFGFNDRAIWLRLTLSNFTQQPDWVLNIPFAQLEKVDFYLVQNDAVITHQTQGKTGQQAFRYPAFAFALDNPSLHDVYLRIESRHNARIVPLDLQNDSSWFTATLTDTILWGAFYGALMMLAVYNITLYRGTQESASFAYVWYMASVIVWELVWGGHLLQLANNSVTRWLSDHSDILFNLVGITAAWFTLRFLNTPKTAPRSHFAIKVILVSQCLLIVFSLAAILPTGTQQNLVYLVNILGILAYLLAGFESYSANYLPARYFIFAWSILLTMALIGLFSLIGVMPSNAFTTYCFQIGVVIEAALFSIAIVDKYRFEMENEITQITDDMRNNLELIEEQNAHLDIARKDAVRASEVKSQFLANVSHEIRTPLNAILGFSRELQSADIGREKREHAQIINAAANNLLGIINDVLDFSKIEAGKININSEPFSPEQMLEEVIGLMSKTAHDKGLQFIYQPVLLPAKLIGDASRIRQILTNLIGNAIKFTPQGHIKLTVNGEYREGSYWLSFAVQDTGIGISSNQQTVLFKAFSQVDDAMNRQFQGTGLGLVISRQLARLMNGDITLESEMGKGSTFTATVRTQLLNSQTGQMLSPQWANSRIRLVEPYAPANHALRALFAQIGATLLEPDSTENADFLFYSTEKPLNDEQLAEVEHAAAKHKILLRPSCLSLQQHPAMRAHFESCMEKPVLYSRLDGLLHSHEHTQQDQYQLQLAALPQIRVLAVDDMELNLRLISTWLKDTPVQLSTCLSGKDAVSRCDMEEFDLILMDVQMPHMDGVQASKRIRQTDLNSGTPIIAVTAHAMKDEQDRLLSSGMDDYLPKPLELEDLVDVIHRWCSPPESKQSDAVDWQKALQASNHNEQIAAEMLRDFLLQLPAMQREIVELAHQHQYQALQQAVHRLHGVCCYTGVPALQNLCNELETLLKKGYLQHALDLIPEFNGECQAVLMQGHQQLNSAGAAH